MKTVDDIRSEWSDYLTYKKNNIKKLWKTELNEQIDKIESLRDEELGEYLDLLCELYFEHNVKIPILHPKIWSKIIKQYKDNISNLNIQKLFWIYEVYTYPDVCKLFDLGSHQILKRILELDPTNKRAKELLFLEKLNTLDYALHELPRGLVVDKKVCIECIDYCEQKIQKDKSFSKIKTRFGLDFKYYKDMFLYWEEYQTNNIKEDFFKWIKTKRLKV